MTHTSAVRAHALAQHVAAITGEGARAEAAARARLETALACLIASLCATHCGVTAAAVFRPGRGKSCRQGRNEWRARACAIVLTRTAAGFTVARAAELFGVNRRAVQRISAEVAEWRERDRKLEAFMDKWETALCGVALAMVDE